MYVQGDTHSDSYRRVQRFHQGLAGLSGNGDIQLTYDQAVNYVNYYPDLYTVWYDPNSNKYGLNDIVSWATAHYNKFGRLENRVVPGLATSGVFTPPPNAPAPSPAPVPAPAPSYSPSPSPAPSYSPAPAPASNVPSYAQLLQIAKDLKDQGYTSGDVFRLLVNTWGASEDLARQVMAGINWNSATPTPSPSPAPAAGQKYTDDEIAFAWIDWLRDAGNTSSGFRAQILAGGEVTLEQLNRVARRADVVAADEAARARAAGQTPAPSPGPSPAPSPGAGTGGPGAPVPGVAPAPGPFGNLSQNSMLMIGAAALALVLVAKN